MDTEKFVNNSIFYDGFEGEPEIGLFIAENPELNIHIWDGYFGNIFRDPLFNGKEWNGFTHDFQQLERTYVEEDIAIDVNEYLNDLYTYNRHIFEFEETRECYELICRFLEYAKKNGKTVKVNWW